VSSQESESERQKRMGAQAKIILDLEYVLPTIDDSEFDETEYSHDRLVELPIVDTPIASFLPSTLRPFSISRHTSPKELILFSTNNHIYAQIRRDEEGTRYDQAELFITIDRETWRANVSIVVEDQAAALLEPWPDGAHEAGSILLDLGSRMDLINTVQAAMTALLAQPGFEVQLWISLRPVGEGPKPALG